MKQFLIILLSIICLSSCKSAKRSTSKSSKRTVKTERKKPVSNKAKSIIEYAKQFEGVRYKYGGASKKGMDCSGLVYTSFAAEDISMPRTTRDLSKGGNWIDVKKIKEGDLVFFATRKNSRSINHVGIVTDTSNDDVAFIHASTSRGVMISKLSERYWYLAYVQARRYF